MFRVWDIFSEKWSVQVKEASKPVSLPIAEQDVSENLYRTLLQPEQYLEYVAHTPVSRFQVLQCKLKVDHKELCRTLVEVTRKAV